jgi:hypothetical protein
MCRIGLAVVVAVSLTLAAPGAVAEPAKAPSGRPWRVGILLEQATGRDAPYLERSFKA